MSDENVLEQAEIDKLFQETTGKPIASTPAARASQPSSPSPNRGPAPAARPSPKTEAVTTPGNGTSNKSSLESIVQTLQSSIDEVSQRMAKLENGNSTAKPPDDLRAVLGTVNQLSQTLETVIREMRDFKGQLAAISRGNKSTPGYNLRNGFTCSVCGSSGNVAVPLRCTKCGSDGWAGWWPEDEP